MTKEENNYEVFCDFILELIEKYGVNDDTDNSENKEQGTD